MVTDDEFMRQVRAWQQTVSSPRFRRFLSTYAELARNQARYRRVVGDAERMSRAIDTSSVERAVEIARVADEVNDRGRWAASISKAVAAMQPALDQRLLATPDAIEAANRTISNAQARDVLQFWTSVVTFLADQAPIAGVGTQGPPAQVEVTDDDIWQAKELADSDVLPEDVLAEFDYDLSETSELDQILNVAADRIASEHPFITREQARRIVVVIAYLAWVGAIVGVAVFTGPIGAAIATALGEVGDARGVANGAGNMIDKAPGWIFSSDPGDEVDDEGRAVDEEE